MAIIYEFISREKRQEQNAEQDHSNFEKRAQALYPHLSPEQAEEKWWEDTDIYEGFELEANQLEPEEVDVFLSRTTLLLYS